MAWFPALSGNPLGAYSIQQGNDFLNVRLRVGRHGPDPQLRPVMQRGKHARREPRSRCRRAGPNAPGWAASTWTQAAPWRSRRGSMAPPPVVPAVRTRQLPASSSFGGMRRIRSSAGRSLSSRPRMSQDFAMLLCASSEAKTVFTPLWFLAVQSPVRLPMVEPAQKWPPVMPKKGASQEMHSLSALGCVCKLYNQRGLV